MDETSYLLCRQFLGSRTTSTLVSSHPGGTNSHLLVQVYPQVELIQRYKLYAVFHICLGISFTMNVKPFLNTEDECLFKEFVKFTTKYIMMCYSKHFKVSFLLLLFSNGE